MKPLSASLAIMALETLRFSVRYGCGGGNWPMAILAIHTGKITKEMHE
jgi:hypothetical protein